MIHLRYDVMLEWSEGMYIEMERSFFDSCVRNPLFFPKNDNYKTENFLCEPALCSPKLASLNSLSYFLAIHTYLEKR